MEAHTAEAKEAEDEDRLPVGHCCIVLGIRVNCLRRFELRSGLLCSRTYSFRVFNVRLPLLNHSLALIEFALYSICRNHLWLALSPSNLHRFSLRPRF